MHPTQVIIEQLLTEKAVSARAQSCYVFKVNSRATKTAVMQAVKKLFKVDVVSVNTSNVRAKRRILGKSIGSTASWKKAYVTLKEGQKIEELEV